MCFEGGLVSFFCCIPFSFGILSFILVLLLELLRFSFFQCFFFACFFPPLSYGFNFSVVWFLWMHTFFRPINTSNHTEPSFSISVRCSVSFCSLQCWLHIKTWLCQTENKEEKRKKQNKKKQNTNQKCVASWSISSGGGLCLMINFSYVALLLMIYLPVLFLLLVAVLPQNPANLSKKPHVFPRDIGNLKPSPPISDPHPPISPKFPPRRIGERPPKTPKLGKSALH